MLKRMFIIVLLLIANGCYGSQFLSKIDISGRILDQKGNIFTDEVTLIAELKYVTYPDLMDVRKSFESQIKTETKTLEKKVQGGIFSWQLPDASSCAIKVLRDGYHNDSVDLEKFNNDGKIEAKDLLLHVVRKGAPSKLEFTDDAKIDFDKSGKIKYGWSFAKRWSFPSDKEEVDIIRYVDENGKEFFTMKEPGGFIYFPGYPQRESAPDETYADFNWMPEAPETGYIKMISPDDYPEQQYMGGSWYFYFKTPQGKYGKMSLSSNGHLNYYLQPDGSRNLEAGEIIKKYPINPIEANRHKGN